MLDLVEQQLSKTIKRGPPDDHEAAVEKVRWFLDSRKKDPKWEIDDSVSFWFDNEFKKQLPLNRLFYGHVGDLGIFAKINGKWKIIVLIEIGGDVGFWHMHRILNKPVKAHPTKHSKALQKKNDKIIRNWCEQNNVVYVVLKKEEILGDCKADKEYWLTGLRHLEECKELKDWIK